MPAKNDVVLGMQPKELGMYLLICKLAEISFHLNFSRPLNVDNDGILILKHGHREGQYLWSVEFHLVVVEIFLRYENIYPLRFFLNLLYNIKQAGSAETQSYPATSG